MDLPTYTNIWRIEKRLYKLYDLRLPMPLPIVWIGVFVGVFVPWSLLLVLVGVPVEMPWHVLFLVPPGIVTWLSTRPVIEGKRLTELLESQLRYLGQPKAWYRLSPTSEPETVTFSGRVWRTSPARAKTKGARKARRPQRRRDDQQVAGPRQVRPAVAAAAAAASQAPVAEPAPTRWGTRRGTAPALKAQVRQGAPGGSGPVRRENVTRDRVLDDRRSAVDEPTADPATRPSHTASPAVAQSHGIAGRERAVPEHTGERATAAEHGTAGGNGTAGRRRNAGSRKATADHTDTVTPDDLAHRNGHGDRGDTGARDDLAHRNGHGDRGDTGPRDDLAHRNGHGDRGDTGPRDDLAHRNGHGDRADTDARDGANDRVGAGAAGSRDVADFREGAGERGEIVGEAEAARATVVPFRTAESRKPAAGKPIDTEALRRLRRLAASADAPADTVGGSETENARREDEVARDQHRKGQPPRLGPALVLPGAQGVWPPLNPNAKPQPRPGPAHPDTTTGAVPGTPGTAETASPLSAHNTPDETPPATDIRPRPATAEDPQDQQDVAGDSPEALDPAGNAPDARGTAGDAPDSQAADDAQGGRDAASGASDERGATGDLSGDRVVSGAPDERGAASKGPDLSAAAGDASDERGATGDLSGDRVVGGAPDERGAAGGDQHERGSGVPDERGVPEGAEAWAAAAAGDAVGGGARESADAPVSDERVASGYEAPDERSVAHGQEAADERSVAHGQEAADERSVAHGREAVREYERGGAKGGRDERVGPVPVPRPGEGRVRRVESVVGRDSGGWRRIAQVVVGGGGVRTDGSEIDEARARSVFGGSRRIVVLGCTGGAGQSTTALMLGHTFATYREDRVVAVDANTGGSTLTSRIQPETPETLTSLLSGLDRVSGYLTMRGYTTRTASGLEVISADTDAGAEQRLADRSFFSDHRLGESMRLLDRHYKLAVIDPAAALAARILPYADQLVLVVPASEEASESVAMTYEWLDGHGCAELRRRAIVVVNGVSRRSMADVEQAESVARGRCRAIVRVPWEDDLAPEGAEVVDPGQLRAAGRRAYLALAGVVVAGFAAQAQTVRPSEEELASDPPGTRIGER
ncbi:TcpE family conjugal transfer membrane protein [Nonomuraea sp. NPDC046802]|uniref:TcpE family conjugal transfer membrane protein n=1 Tax=Nonomuraea sp. NPDC046802 TaxID=3154919 RepID=UPI0033EE8F81